MFDGIVKGTSGARYYYVIFEEYSLNDMNCLNVGKKSAILAAIAISDIIPPKALPTYSPWYNKVAGTLK